MAPTKTDSDWFEKDGTWGKYRVIMERTEGRERLESENCSVSQVKDGKKVLLAVGDWKGCRDYAAQKRKVVEAQHEKESYTLECNEDGFRAWLLYSFDKPRWYVGDPRADKPLIIELYDGSLRIGNYRQTLFDKTIYGNCFEFLDHRNRIIAKSKVKCWIYQHQIK